MAKSINEIFQEYLGAHVDDEVIDFEPLIKRHPDLREDLIKKIHAYHLASSIF
jgi:hypothetical protein